MSLYPYQLPPTSFPHSLAESRTVLVLTLSGEMIQQRTVNGDDPQHDFISLHLGAKLSSLYSRAQRPCLSTVDSLTDLDCASRREMSVHLGTPRVRTPPLWTYSLLDPICGVRGVRKRADVNKFSWYPPGCSPQERY